MKKIIFKFSFYILFLITINKLNAQGWFNTYNGPGNNLDVASAIAVDDSGNVYVTGYSRNSTGKISEDWATIKRDKFGARLWVNRLNGGQDNYDRGNDLVIDNSGNIIVAGFSYGSADQFSYEDYTVAKYFPDGTADWVEYYNGSSSDHDIAYAVTVDDNGYIYVTGGSWADGSNYDIATLKYTPGGDTVWGVSYNSGPGWDKGRAIAVDGSGNVYVSGTSSEYWGNSSIVTIKYSPGGSQSWLDLFNGSGDGDDYCASLALDGSGNVVVVGTVFNDYSYNNGTMNDWGIIKYTSGGNIVWEQFLTGPGYEDDSANDVVIDDDGNIYVTGFLRYGDDSSGDDIVTAKYKPNGLTEWTALYGDSVEMDHGQAIDIDSDGNVYVTGISNDDIVTIKYDNLGNEIWVERESNGGYQIGTDIYVDDESNVYVSGYGENFPENYDYITIKYPSASTVVEDEKINPSELFLYQNYPNPFNPSTKIRFTIPQDKRVETKNISLIVYDVLGNEVATLVNEEKSAGEYEVEFNTSSGIGNPASGIYFYQLRAGSFIQTKKMVLLR